MDDTKQLHWTEPLWKELHAISEDYEALEQKLSPVPIHFNRSEKLKSRKPTPIDFHALDDFNMKLFPEIGILENRLTKIDAAVQSDKTIFHGVKQAKNVKPVKSMQETTITSSESKMERKSSIENEKKAKKPVRNFNLTSGSKDLKTTESKEIIDDPPLYKVMLASVPDPPKIGSPGNPGNGSSDRIISSTHEFSMNELSECSSFICSKCSDIPSNALCSGLTDFDTYSIRSSEESLYEYSESEHHAQQKNSIVYERECIIPSVTQSFIRDKPTNTIICNRNIISKEIYPLGHTVNPDCDHNSSHEKENYNFNINKRNPQTISRAFIMEVKKKNAECRETLETTESLLSNKK